MWQTPKKNLNCASPEGLILRDVTFCWNESMAEHVHATQLACILEPVNKDQFYFGGQFRFWFGIVGLGVLCVMC